MPTTMKQRTYASSSHGVTPTDTQNGDGCCGSDTPKEQGTKAIGTPKEQGAKATGAPEGNTNRVVHGGRSPRLLYTIAPLTKRYPDQCAEARKLHARLREQVTEKYGAVSQGREGQINMAARSELTALLYYYWINNDPEMSVERQADYMMKALQAGQSRVARVARLGLDGDSADNDPFTALYAPQPPAANPPESDTAERQED